MKPIQSIAIQVKSKKITNYCYLISNQNTKESILIDPAWDLDKIENVIKRTGTKLVAILITHHHGDHIHLANPLAIKYNIPVYMHVDEQSFYNFKCTNLVTYQENLLYEAGIKIEVILVPGHTKGSVCYLINNEIFTGDTLFIEGCGECVCKGSSTIALYDSLQKILTLPDSTKVYPGHRYKRLPGMSLKYVRQNNIYLQTSDKEAFIHFHTRNNV